MVRKTGEQVLSDWKEHTVEEVEQKSVLSMPLPEGLNVSDEDDWFHFPSHSLASWGAFSKGKAYSAAAVA